MAILEIFPYDLNLVNPALVAAGRDFWARLPELTTGPPTARLLMVADSFDHEDVLAGFRRYAVPETHLPEMVRAYRAIFENYIQQATRRTRYMRLFLIMNSHQPAEALARLTSSYGLRSRPIEGPVPLPFAHLDNRWTRGRDPQGQQWAVVQSRLQQTGRLHLTYLHSLLALDFPLWTALDIETIPKAAAMQMLRRKTTSARFERSTDMEAQAEAADVKQIATLLRSEIQHAGMGLHHFRLSILVSGANDSQLKERLQIVRSACGISLQDWDSPVEQARPMFTATPPVKVAGSLVSTRGILAAAGSPLVYRRRTATHGVMLGTDMNNAPVIFNLFDERHPSYCVVLLGVPGSGKTFTIQLKGLRHLLLGCRIIMVDPQGNIDWSFLGDDVCQTVRLGTRQSQLNVLDIIHDELPAQIESALSRLKLLDVYGEYADDRLARPILDQQLGEIYGPIWAERQQLRSLPTLQHLKHRLDALAEAEGNSEIGLTARNMAYRLIRYTEGSQAELFGQHSTVDFSLSYPVTIFDISALPDANTEGNLRAALLSILVGSTSQGIKGLRASDHPASTAPIIWFIDEIGVLMRDPVIARNTSHEYKTARSRLVSMIVADQDLPSLLGQRDATTGTHHGQLMLANAAIVQIFKQREGQRTAIRENFPELPVSLEERIYHQGVGQCLLQLPNDVLQMQVRPSEFEKILLSSRLQDRQRRQEVVAKLRSYLGAETT